MLTNGDTTREPAATDREPAHVYRAVLVATVLGSSLAFIDGAVVNVALPALQVSLRASATLVQWIMNAYLLMLGALVLLGGAAADRYGRRRVFVIGTALFAVASLACALAPTAAWLVAARAMQGAAAAMLTPASLALLGALDEEARPRAFGVWAGAGALTTALGPVLGGWLVDVVGWRAIFLINLPLAAIAIGVALRGVPESRDEDARPLDATGASSAAAGLGAVTYGLTAVPEQGWTATTLVAMVGGVVLLVAFIVVERRSAAPMLPLALFGSRDFSVLNGMTFLLYAALGAVFFLLPFELIVVDGYSATAAGAALLPFALVLGAFSSSAGRLAARIGIRTQLCTGPLVAAVGIALLALAPGTSYWTARFPALIVLAIGMTLTVAPLTAAVIGAVDSRHAGVASGFNSAVARIAGLLAVALSTLAVAAVQGAVGQGTDVLAGADPAAFERGFRMAMYAAGVAAGLGGTAVGLWLTDAGRRRDDARA